MLNIQGDTEIVQYLPELFNNAGVKARKHCIAERSKDLRYLHRISQSTLCKAIDINRITYAGYEGENPSQMRKVLRE